MMTGMSGTLRTSGTSRMLGMSGMLKMSVLTDGSNWPLLGVVFNNNIKFIQNLNVVEESAKEY